MTPAAREKRLRKMMRCNIGFVFMAVGAIYLIGPAEWQSSGNFAVLLEVGVPFWAWNISFIAGGLALLIDLRIGNWVPYLVLTVVGIFWAFCLVATLFTGTADAGGTPIWVLGFAFHALIGLYFTYLDYVHSKAVSNVS